MVDRFCVGFDLGGAGEEEGGRELVDVVVVIVHVVDCGGGDDV